MEKKVRKIVSYSFGEDVIKKFESYCNKKKLNRSRLVEELVIEFLNNPHPPKEQNKESSDGTTQTH